MKTLRIATRGSQLALWQANWIKDQIIAQFPEMSVELVVIKTTGDKITDRPLSQVGGKGLFVKELEQSMLNHETDIAVHSMKDVPAFLPEGLEISTITKRESPFDGLISANFNNLDELPKGAVVGTSSLRRASQLKAYRPDIQIKSLRGNIDTRIKKTISGEYDASILAVAGLKRMGWDAQIKQILPTTIMLPAIAQGAVGIENRIDDEATLAVLKHLQDNDTTACVTAERTVLQILEGNCQVPLAGYCTIANNELTLKAMIADPEGTKKIAHEGTTLRRNATDLGKAVAEKILENGGRTILEQLAND